MIAVIDYGAGNLFSVVTAFKEIGLDARPVKTPSEISDASHIILPGVGAFSDAMEKLRANGLDFVIKAEVQRGKPLLGICLGMQVLFDSGTEHAETAGLSLIPGKIEPLAPSDRTLDIPHMGWNNLHKQNCGITPMSHAIDDDQFVYFVHSFAAVCDPRYVVAYCNYGGEFPAFVTNGENVYGCQFHPEKSGEKGLGILREFCKL